MLINLNTSHKKDKLYSMKIIKRLGLYFSLVTIIGCSSPQNSTSNYLNLNLGAEPSFLNPILHSDSASSSVSGLLFNGLMKVNSDLEIEPDLAESYTISKNGLIYTIKLKPSIFFHDGHPLDAEDVVFTFQTILNPKTNTVRRSNYQINGKNIRFESIDSLTVKISLPEPFSPFLTNLTMGILPKHLLENEDINTSDFNRNPIGTGPFKFVDWRPSQYVKLERNDQYFYKKAKVPGILMKIIPDKNTARISLQKGEIDIEGGVQAKDVTLLEKETHLNLYDYYSLGYTCISAST